MNKKIVFAGPVGTRSGYGARSRDLCKALINLGYDLTIVPLKWGTTPTDALDINDESDKKILERINNQPLTYKPDIFIHCTIPNEFQAAGTVNIGITAGIETDICDPTWIEGCNKMDLVLTSSTHSAEVFKNIQFEQKDSNGNIVSRLKLEKPCHVLFEGVDTDIFNEANVNNKEIIEYVDNIPEKNAFIFVGHWLQGDLGQDRKDVGMMIVTFLNAFKKIKKSEQPALILKTALAGFSAPEKFIIEDRIRHCIATARNDGYKGELPSIYLLHGDLTDSDMNTLYNHPKIKAMVSFTKGEGYGRPLLEFTTTGKPVIASNWSGQLDFLHSDKSTLLPGTINKVHPSAVNQWIINDSKWFTVNYNYAAQILSNSLSIYPELLAKAIQQQNYTLKHFTLKNMEEKLHEYLENIEEFIIVNEKPIEKKLNLPSLI